MKSSNPLPEHYQTHYLNIEQNVSQDAGSVSEKNQFDNIMSNISKQSKLTKIYEDEKEQTMD